MLIGLFECEIDEVACSKHKLILDDEKYINIISFLNEKYDTKDGDEAEDEMSLMTTRRGRQVHLPAKYTSSMLLNLRCTLVISSSYPYGTCSHSFLCMLICIIALYIDRHNVYFFLFLQ